ncbi:hypothetical protein AC579_7257 [Pseudocercospora musae]|uniref:Uncharacterized protein n=1 Tax=Pseudocercospora musae TaxID=113226 RepID=A0A139I9M7_9PEZI|nr:hypothetical protein AC579_7257 [Pseudocercospora musae]
MKTLESRSQDIRGRVSQEKSNDEKCSKPSLLCTSSFSANLVPGIHGASTPPAMCMEPDPSWVLAATQNRKQGKQVLAKGKVNECFPRVAGGASKFRITYRINSRYLDQDSGMCKIINSEL